MAPVPALSTALNTVSYDPDALILELQYAGGKGLLYRYHGVPPEVFDELTRAWALGAFVNERIKPRYPFERLTFAQAAARPLSDITRRWHHPLVGGFTKARRALRRRGLSRAQSYRALGVEPPERTSASSGRSARRASPSARSRRCRGPARSSSRPAGRR